MVLDGVGNLAEWVAASAAVLAVVAAAASAFLSARAVTLSRGLYKATAAAYQADLIEREQAQARFVYSITSDVRWIEAGRIMRGREPLGRSEHFQGKFKEPLNSGERVLHESSVLATITVYNRSAEVMGPFHLTLYDKHGGEILGHPIFDMVDGPLIPPGESRRYEIEAPDSGGGAPRADLRFCDSSGRWWRRRENHPIERVEPPVL